jgi:hypothetical protein
MAAARPEDSVNEESTDSSDIEMIDSEAQVSAYQF